ncbi:hypothetical protein [Azorhizobium sp. AG788]|uniref:hypothetical protein n=1 Tax=Azorhizobium sp. AG788 TaxID=2183897 RepID=UPI003138C436
MKILTLAAALGLICAASAASADRPAADKCAAKLSADAQTIYKASAPLITPGADARAVITDQTKAMVMNGSLSRGAAKPAAEAAGTCIKLINS